MSTYQHHSSDINQALLISTVMKSQPHQYYGGVGSLNNPIEISINIYDLHPYNKYLHWLGLGAYHSGVVIYGREYTYGLHSLSSSGVFETPLKLAGGAVYRCTYQCKHTCTLTQAEFHELLQHIQ